MPLFPRNTLVLATRNQGKVREMERYLAGQGISITTASALHLPEVPETGTTFEANALLKAEACAAASGLAVLADDSGLEVDLLDSAPGVYSADWGGPERNFRMAMARLRSEVDRRIRSGASAASAGEGERHGDLHRARFVSVLILKWPDGRLIKARGTVDGALVFPPRGTGGFGYDPCFRPTGDSKTFGEMTPTEKARYSHRKRAMDVLLGQLCL
ncbi:MAG: non-canonical purine NTP pyrophosphatase [Pseudomonadota bacterium]